MEIAYEIDGPGWARARVADERHSVDLTASYISDALGNLITAVADLMMKGTRETRCSWDEEPGEFRWIFTREGRTAHVRILQFKQFKPLQYDEPDSAGRVLFETVQPLDVLGQAVADCAASVLDHYGERQYRERWIEFPFPDAALEQLRNQLNPVYEPTRRRHGKG